MMSNAYSWQKKTFKEMSKTEFRAFCSAYRSIWHFFIVANGYHLYGEDSKGRKITLETDISKNKYYNFTWADKPFSQISQGELMEETETFFAVMYCLIVANHQDIKILGWRQSNGKRKR
ncbi:MAG: hypothetical protein K6G63_03655 [Eubacterium sp.]|nr:hypothetical protein [Eubacterium sp.]